MKHFEYNQVVWFIMANRVQYAPIYELRVDNKGRHYYFWGENVFKDQSVSTENLFEIKEERLFATKEELIKSISES